MDSTENTNQSWSDLTDNERAKIKNCLIDFVERVSSEHGQKTPEEVNALPGIVSFLCVDFRKFSI